MQKIWHCLSLEQPDSSAPALTRFGPSWCFCIPSTQLFFILFPPDISCFIIVIWSPDWTIVSHSTLNHSDSMIPIVPILEVLKFFSEIFLHNWFCLFCVIYSLVRANYFMLKKEKKKKNWVLSGNIYNFPFSEISESG